MMIRSRTSCGLLRGQSGTLRCMGSYSSPSSQAQITQDPSKHATEATTRASPPFATSLL